MVGTHHPSESGDEHAPRVSDELQLEVDLLASQDTSRRADARDQGAGGGATQLAILVIGANADLRAYIRQCLERYDQAVNPILEARTVTDALREARRHPIDLVISDASISGMDSYELCRTLRTDPAVGQLPILLVVSEPSNRVVLERTRRARANAVLAQPFNAHKLCALVGQLLKKD